MFASYGLIKLNETWFSEPSRQRHRLQRRRATTLARWPKRTTKMSMYAPLAIFAGGRGHGLSMMPSLGIIGPLRPSSSTYDDRPPDGGVTVIVGGWMVVGGWAKRGEGHCISHVPMSGQKRSVLANVLL